MKRWTLQILTWCVFNLRLYYMWSKVYQWLYEKRKWNQITIPLFASFEEIEETLGKMIWRRDSWPELWDAISLPQATYGRHLVGNKSGDCDDISIFAAYCIERARRRTGLNRPILEVGFLSCPWVDHKNELGGHNVCTFSYYEKGETKWAYVSNWYEGRIQWGFPSKDVIVTRMTGTHRPTLGWGFAVVTLKNQKLKLKLTEYHWPKGE